MRDIWYIPENLWPIACSRFVLCRAEKVRLKVPRACLIVISSCFAGRYNFLQIIVDCRHKCKVSSIMLEMDRMLRPGGTVYIRDTISVMSELQEIATATRWVCTLRDTGEGPHASWKILTCDKRMPWVCHIGSLKMGLLSHGTIFSIFYCDRFCTLVTIPLWYKRVPNSSEKIHLQISCHTVMATSLICYCIHTQAQARTNDLNK